MGEIETTLFFLKLNFVNSTIDRWVILICSIMLAFIFVWHKGQLSKTRQRGYLLLSSLFLVLGVFEVQTAVGLDSIDTVGAFQAQSRNVTYSPEFIEATRSKKESGQTCFVGAGPGAGKNVIMLILESYSAYHSSHFLASSSYMPRLDALASNGKLYTNFHANGYTTEAGLISMFTGKFPMAATRQSRSTNFSYTGFYDIENTLPKVLNQSGYETEFFTTGNLGFLGKGNWLKMIGYDYVEGSENEFYEGWPRFLFDAAADEALFLRVEQRLDDFKDGEKYFLAIENVSTHKPFIDPVTGEQSEKKAFLYADEQIARFYDFLSSRGFFDNGILIVVGDHRSMTPIRPIEQEAYGLRAPARTPMIIFGMGEGTESEPFQQIDMLPSLANYLTDSRYCADRYQGIFLPRISKKPECILHVPGLNPNNIYAYCDNHNINVLLDGDATRVVSENSSYPEKQQLLDSINSQRIEISSKVNFL
jgi:phosphoglycerol transferase MdoB-like AlkP superfamily enzyme